MESETNSTHPAWQERAFSWFGSFWVLLLHQLQNQFLGGSIALAVAGLIASSIWAAVRAGKSWLATRLFVQYDFSPGSAAHFALTQWLSTHPDVLRSSSRRSVAIASGPDHHRDEAEDLVDVDPDFTFHPVVSSEVRLWWRGRLLWVRGGESGKTGAGSGGWMTGAGQGTGVGAKMTYGSGLTFGEGCGEGGGGSCSLSLCVLGGGSDKVVSALLREGHAALRSRDMHRTRLFRLHAPPGGRGCAAWVDGGARARRPLRSVVLEEGQAEALVADAREFVRSERWYAERGIPYRRGYLLSGAAGSGKTSLVQAVAGELRLPLYMLRLSAPGLDDHGLASLFAAAAPRSLLLLDDIDTALPALRPRAPSLQPDRATDGGSGGVTLGGLLSAIDGVGAAESRLLFLTCNHPDLLDPALLRPGRVDYTLRFGLASRQQLATLFARFFEPPPGNHQRAGEGGGDTGAVTALTVLGEKFASAIPEGSVTMAAAVGFLLRYPHDPVHYDGTSRDQRSLHT